MSNPTPAQLGWIRHSVRLNADRLKKSVDLSGAEQATIRRQMAATDKLLRYWAGTPETLTPADHAYATYLLAWSAALIQHRAREISDREFYEQATNARAALKTALEVNRV